MRQVTDQRRGKTCNMPHATCNMQMKQLLIPRLYSAALGALKGASSQIYRASESARGIGRHAAIQLWSVAATAQGESSTNTQLNLIKTELLSDKKNKNSFDKIQNCIKLN